MQDMCSCVHLLLFHSAQDLLVLLPLASHSHPLTPDLCCFVFPSSAPYWWSPGHHIISDLNAADLLPMMQQALVLTCVFSESLPFAFCSRVCPFICLLSSLQPLIELPSYTLKADPGHSVIFLFGLTPVPQLLPVLNYFLILYFEIDKIMLDFTICGFFMMA